MSPVFRSIRLKNGTHNLGKPITHCSCSLRFTIICGTTEVKAFGDKGFVLKESIEVISFLKIIFPAKEIIKLTLECKICYLWHFVLIMFSVSISKVHALDIKLTTFLPRQWTQMQGKNYFFCRDNKNLSR